MYKEMCEECKQDISRRLMLERAAKDIIIRLTKDLSDEEFYSLKNQLRYIIEKIK